MIDPKPRLDLQANPRSVIAVHIPEEREREREYLEKMNELDMEKEGDEMGVEPDRRRKKKDMHAGISRQKQKTSFISFLHLPGLLRIQSYRKQADKALMTEERDGNDRASTNSLR